MTELRATVFPRFVRDMGRGMWGGDGLPIPPVICLSSAVCDLILDLMCRSHVDQLREFAPAPFTHGFVEWHHTDVGDGQPIGAAFAQQSTDGVGPEAWFWSHDIKMLGVAAWDSSGLFVDRKHKHWPSVSATIKSWDEVADDVIGHWDRLWVTTCAVLAAPGVRTNDERIRDKGLRNSPVQTAPLVTYRCVDVDIDKLAGIPEVGIGQSSDRRRHCGVALHHVRGHLRLTEKGLIPVRAHWRGDAARGARLRSHNVMRSEEMH